MKLTVSIEPDEFTEKVAQAFDLEFDGTISTEIPDFSCPKDFNIGMIVGASGSGKTQILQNHFRVKTKQSIWLKNKAIVSHFETPEEAIEKLFACGLASVPTLCKPFHVLSNGEKYRAIVARKLGTGMILDEFTSEVNRETAKSLSVSLSKYIRSKDITGVVLSSCHKDIVEWIEPDWVFDCDSGERFVNDDPRQSLRKVARIEIL
jgi:ABC-type lipoprotein export system ATPase subunit|tara:strand:+ start:531 stop:1148 length:618 start_codon:yes stop_codon:yes gene_type:complete